MTSKREEAIKMVSEMISPEAAEFMNNSPSSEEFGAEIGSLALENVFGALWTRPGLNRRDRSLITLSILITLRASEELHFHFPIAIKNGVTRKEIEELIYHCSGYAGFPAAASARQLALKLIG